MHINFLLIFIKISTPLLLHKSLKSAICFCTASILAFCSLFISAIIKPRLRQIEFWYCQDIFVSGDCSKRLLKWAKIESNNCRYLNWNFCIQSEKIKADVTVQFWLMIISSLSLSPWCDHSKKIADMQISTALWKHHWNQDLLFMTKSKFVWSSIQMLSSKQN